MKRWLISLTLLFSTTLALAKGPVKELDVIDFSRGVDTYHDASSIPDGFVQDVRNVYFNRQAPIEKRKGYTVLFTSKSYSFTNGWSYTDTTNTTWIILRTSDVILASNFAGSVVKISTVSTTDTVDEATAFGNAFFVDPTQGVYFWNGTSTTYVASSPKGSIITTFHNRLWVSGQASPNDSLVNASKLLDGVTWTTGNNPGDPSQFNIGMFDNFDHITALYTFLDTLYIMKYSSIFALYGFDNTNFQISILTRECGCIDKNTIQAFNRGLRFVSLRGVEKYDGYSCTRISDPIKNKIDNAISVTSFNQQSWVQDSQTDWQAGTSPTLSFTISAGDVVPSTFATTETSKTQWSLGTANNMTVGTSSISLSTNNSGTATNPSFESALGGTWTESGSLGPTNFTKVTTLAGDCTISPQSGSNFALGTVGADNVFLDGFFEVVDLSGNILATSSAGAMGTGCSWTQVTVTPSINNTGKRVKFRASISYGGIREYITTADSYILGGAVSVYMTSTSKLNPINRQYYVAFDNIQNGSSTITTGNFTSQAINTGLTYSYVLSSASWTVNTATPTFVLQKGASSVGPWFEVAQGTGSNTQINMQYIRYITTFTVSGSDTDLTSLTGVNFIATSSGVFTSQSHSISGISQFSTFLVTQDVSGGGSIAYAMCTANNSGMSGKVCANQTANAEVTVTTNTWVQFIATMTVTSATDTPKLSQTTLQWFSGTKASPMSSVVYDNKYWLSVSTDSTLGSNNTILIQDVNDSWTIFDIKAGTLVLVKNVLYHGDSSSTGNVYQDDQGYSDNGVAINAYIKTKDYNIGSQIVDTLFDSAWPSAINLDNSSLKIMYSVDRGSTLYSLATIPQSEFASTKYARIPFPFSSTNPNTGQSINFTIQNNDNNGQMQFQGMSFLYHDRQPLE